MEVANSAGTEPQRHIQLYTLIALDVANAFNSARWEKIEEALCKKKLSDYMLRILKSYLSNRELLFGDSDSCEVSHEVTCGVPQESVLGPLLWNIMYDSLLEIDLGGNSPGYSSSSLVAFADDVALIATGRDTENLESAMNTALARVAEWMEDNDLKLAIPKTEAIMLTSKRAYERPSFMINGEPVQLKEQIRYLGVELNRSMSFKNYIKTAAAKAEKTAAALTRILPNVGGPRQRIRKILSSVVHSQLLYAAPVWSGSLVHEHYVKMLERPQRTIGLRVAMAYRTVSTQAALVVSGLIPAYLMAIERTETANGRKEGNLDTTETRNRTLQKWQEEWDSSDTGRWAHRLIRDVK
uniref:Retrovirus-related Pol polyprotein from type-1 retrotransposable element R1 2 n=1 Tax=Sipha flava TaxID=143950 RepID=A0A2S2QP02_9HEMI